MIVSTFAIGGWRQGPAGFYALMFKQVHSFRLYSWDQGLHSGCAGWHRECPRGEVGRAFFSGLIDRWAPVFSLRSWDCAPYQLKISMLLPVLVLVLIFRPTGILGDVCRGRRPERQDRMKHAIKIGADWRQCLKSSCH